MNTLAKFILCGSASLFSVRSVVTLVQATLLPVELIAAELDNKGLRAECGGGFPENACDFEHVHMPGIALWDRDADPTSTDLACSSIRWYCQGANGYQPKDPFSGCTPQPGTLQFLPF